MSALDLLIRQSYLAPHVAPIWNALPEKQRGTVYVATDAIPEVSKLIDPAHIQPYQDGGECGHNLILTASYGDATFPIRKDASRRVILMEHGIGFTFGYAAYADGTGWRNRLACFLYPNEHTAGKVHESLQEKPSAVIGVPKMDRWKGPHCYTMPAEPTIAISFHHGDKNATPGVVGSAWEHYADILPFIAKRYKLLLHAHPIFADDSPLRQFYKSLDAEFVPDFNEIMHRADVYINDASSTAYEFLVTGKPVILLNAPWFDQSKDYGLRFWEYADIGEQVDEPNQLVHAIDRTIAQPERFIENRRRAVKDLFPYLGESAERAAGVIMEYMEKTYLPPIQIRHTTPPAPAPKPEPMPAAAAQLRPAHTSTERGIVYMCFGEKAESEMTRSIRSLRSVGSSLPVYVIANKAPELISNEVFGVHVWDGESPYDASRARNFQFRAGRIKPSLYRLSPFEQSLYVDVDTEFMIDPEIGFGFLQHWDFVIAQERLSIGELYNRRGAGWEHDIAERDVTVQEFGGDGNFPFINSGVFFWKKKEAVCELFDLWRSEWERFQNWDEQKALMRALNKSSVRPLVLSEQWNHPHKRETQMTVRPAEVIYHAYGRGAAREDVQP